jgi:gamma-glutamyltranspeptidase / glutathione hydrolase
LLPSFVPLIKNSFKNRTGRYGKLRFMSKDNSIKSFRKLIGLLLGITLYCLTLICIQAKDLPKTLSTLAPTKSSPITDPEMFYGFVKNNLVTGKQMMVATASPDASRAAFAILKMGGNATDAAIAASIMLTLTEPNATGIGGGGFLVYYDAKTKITHAFDGRETAPETTTPTRFLLPNGDPMGFQDAVASGKSVGTPGLLKMLEKVHQSYGKLPWKKLFEPSIQLAQQGFAISPRLSFLIGHDPSLKNNPQARAYFYDAHGQALPAGKIVKNPALAKVLTDIANQGSDVFYQGWIADHMVQALQNDNHPGDLSKNDLLAYQAIERPILCHHYRIWKICGMPPPASGTLAILQMLSILEGYPMSNYPPHTWQGIHLFSEAGRLAFADRDEYIADPDFIPPPIQGMLDPSYISTRRSLINWDQSMKKALPGTPPGVLAQFSPDSLSEVAGTSHISIIDAEGNAISLTQTIESQFGSRIMVDGFLLNNQLTDFSFVPEIDGKPVANRVEPHKRPRSSMAPILVFDQNNRVIMSLGSAGGSGIINYVAKTLVAVLDWQMNIQEAISLPNFGSRNQSTDLEKMGHWEEIVPELEKRGHMIRYFDYPSGVQGITSSPTKSMGKISSEPKINSAPIPWSLYGAVDPRRQGLAIGK